jgi:hypothetical protein
MKAVLGQHHIDVRMCVSLHTIETVMTWFVLGTVLESFVVASAVLFLLLLHHWSKTGNINTPFEEARFSNLVFYIKGIRCAGHVGSLGENINACKSLVGKLQRKKLIGRATGS